MMKEILSILVMLGVATFIFAQAPNATAVNNVEPTTTEEAGGAVMSFEAKEINYGVIEQGADPYRFFKFTNEGNEPLIIKHAKGSCGCTVPTYPKEPIAPGESGEIKVRYDTKRIGKFTKKVTLTTNSVEEKIVLTITGQVNKKEEAPSGVPENAGGLFDGK